jgi:RNA polymerase sigma-70 factor, ECF subfamily
MHPTSPAASIPEPELLAAARGGDEQAFERLIEPHRRELHAHCYRMLGSVEDAEDALQEAWVRAWRGMGRFEGRSSLRSWLYRIATNACLRAIERRPTRILPLDYGPPADPHDDPAPPLIESAWIDPYPDHQLLADDDRVTPESRYEIRESLELAFIAALQHLPARQRAVLILRDVLAFSPAEIAEILDASPPAVYSALQRAHKAVDETVPAESQQQTLRALGDRRVRELVEDYVSAWERGDVDAIKEMLAADATMSMPPRPSWFRGREAIGDFLAAWPLARGRSWRLTPLRANGQLAFAVHAPQAKAAEHEKHGIHVLALDRDGRIADMTAFLD